MIPLVLLDHHFRRFDNRCHGVTLLELEFFGATTGNDALNEVGPHANDDVRHYVSEHNLLDLPA